MYPLISYHFLQKKNTYTKKLIPVFRLGNPNETILKDSTGFGRELGEALYLKPQSSPFFLMFSSLNDPSCLNELDALVVVLLTPIGEGGGRRGGDPDESGSVCSKNESPNFE